jgi:hypothetical protein
LGQFMPYYVRILFGRSSLWTHPDNIKASGAVAPCNLNAQIGYAGPQSNYDEQKVGTYLLPDPLTMQDGTRVTDAKTWMERRRPEIVRLFEDNEYGRSPGRPSDMSFDVFEKGTPAFDGTAIRKQITVYLTADKNGPKFDLLLYTPANAKGPVPVLLQLGFGPNSSAVDDPGVRQGLVWTKDHQHIPAPPRRQPSGGSPTPRPGGLPIPRLLREGYGVATFNYQDVEPDSGDGLPYGIRAHYLKDKTAQPAPNEWGAIAACAWGMSRAEDYLETDPAVDAKKVAIFGVSRLGKTVMWAGGTLPADGLVARCPPANGSSSGFAVCAHPDPHSARAIANANLCRATFNMSILIHDSCKFGAIREADGFF